MAMMAPVKSTHVLLALIRPHRQLAIWALALAVLVSGMEFISAALVMPFIQILGGSGSSSSLKLPRLFQALIDVYTGLPARWQLLAVLGSLFVLTILKNISQYFSSISINDLRLRIGFTIRQQCIERFLQLEMPFYSRANLGELLSYVNEQAQRTETLSSYILEIARDVLVISMLFVLLVSLSPILTLVTVANLAVVALLLRLVIRAVQTYGRQSAQAIEEFSTRVTELVSGIRVVKSFNAESREQQNANQTLHERYSAELSAYRYNSAVVPLTETTGITVLLVLLAVGSVLFPIADGGALPFFLTYMLALLRMLPKVSHINSMRSQLSLLSGSLDKIHAFLTSTANTSLPDGTNNYSRLRAGLAFEDVTFTYPSNSEPTLQGVSLLMPQGKTTAIVGPSGSGKSTLVDLVMRFHDPDSGCITLDGVDLREIRLRSWRQAIAMVSQDTFLFHASVRDNIAYGCPDASEQAIVDAAKKAYAYEFIQELPQGLDTLVGSRGTRLSGGQRQRIAIARAILRDPDILILDEATSALDSNSERIVQKAIEEVSRNRTVIVIAHRLSTIENADNIVVLRDGQVVEQGTHTELIAATAEYWSLYHSQTALISAGGSAA